MIKQNGYKIMINERYLSTVSTGNSSAERHKAYCFKDKESIVYYNRSKLIKQKHNFTTNKL